MVERERMGVWAGKGRSRGAKMELKENKEWNPGGEEMTSDCRSDEESEDAM